MSLFWNDSHISCLSVTSYISQIILLEWNSSFLTDRQLYWIFFFVCFCFFVFNTSGWEKVNPHQHHECPDMAGRRAAAPYCKYQKVKSPSYFYMERSIRAHIVMSRQEIRDWNRKQKVKEVKGRRDTTFSLWNVILRSRMF